MTPAIFRAIFTGIAATFLGLAAINLNLVGLLAASRGTALVGLAAAAFGIIGDRISRQGATTSPTPRAMRLVLAGAVVCLFALVQSLLVSSHPTLDP
ncbi:hypothetical protein [Alkalisalibacterium limincola]|uniref:Uncharacterized protein n=1 Tax=Alkalisalibacterium limincola TaxID=2699169 RepID=A0A5C8KYN2_9GAMM|nr:hypothetical protein [Alkalisalibacterium limincola]TXK64385.1 hypothetical protein FU658_05665 [Alkalisalibacterium limincola]